MSSFKSYHSILTPKQTATDLDSSSDDQDPDGRPPPVPLKDSSSSIWSISSASSSIDQSFHHHQQTYNSDNDQSSHHYDPNAYQSTLMPLSQQSTIRGNQSRPSSAMIEIENARHATNGALGLENSGGVQVESSSTPTFLSDSSLLFPLFAFVELRQREDSSSTSPDDFFSPKMWPSAAPTFTSSFDSHHSIDPDYEATASSYPRRHRPSLPDHFVDAEQIQPPSSYPSSNHSLSASEEDNNRLSAGGIFGSSSSRSRSSNGQARSRTASQASSKSRSGLESNSPGPSASNNAHGLNISTSDLPDPSTFPLPPNSTPSSAQVSPCASKNSNHHYSSDMSLRHSGSTRGSTWTERSLASSRTSASAVSDKGMTSPCRTFLGSSSSGEERSVGEVHAYEDAEGDSLHYDAAYADSDGNKSSDVDALAVGLGISSDNEEAYGVRRSKTVTAGKLASETSVAAQFDGPFAHHRQPSWTRRQDVASSMVMTPSSSADQSDSAVQIERPTLARLQSEMTLDTYQQQQQQFRYPPLARERNPSVGEESILSQSASSQGHSGVLIPPRTGSRSRTISETAQKSSSKSSRIAHSPTPSDTGSGIERVQSPSRSSSLKKPSKKSSSSKMKNADGTAGAKPDLSNSAGLRSHGSSPSLSSPISPTFPASRVRGRAESLSTMGSAFEVLLSADSPQSPASELSQEELIHGTSPQSQPQFQASPQIARRRANTRESGPHPLSIDTTGAEDRVKSRSRNASVSSIGESMLSYRKNSTATSSSASSRNGSGGPGSFRRGGPLKYRADSISGQSSFMMPPSSDYSYDDEDDDGYSGSNFGFVESYMDANPDESDDAAALKTVLDGTGVVIEANGRPLSEVEREVGPDTTHLVLGGCNSPEMSLFLEKTLPLISHSLLALDLSDTGLKTVPSAISLCNSLEELNLSSNPFQFSSSNKKTGNQTLPSWLGTLPSLRVLVIDDLNIECLPKSFQNLKELKTLSIMKNQFTHLPSWLHHCSKLERLCLEDNKFQGAWIKILAPLLSNVQAPTQQQQQLLSRSQSGSMSAPAKNTTFDASNAPPIPIRQGDPPNEQSSLPASASSTSSFGWTDSISRGGLRPLMRRMQSAGDLKNGKPQGSTAPSSDDMPVPGGMTRAAASYNDALDRAGDQTPHQPMPGSNNSILSSPNASKHEMKISQPGSEDSNVESKWGYIRKKMGRKASSNRIYTLASESGRLSGTEGKSSRPTSRAGSTRGTIAETFGLSTSGSVVASLGLQDLGPGSAPLTPFSPNHGFAEAQSSASSLSTVEGGTLGHSANQMKRKSFFPIQTSIPLSANAVHSTYPGETQDPEVHQRRLRALLHYLKDLDDLGPSLANSRSGPAGFDPPSPSDSPTALRRQQSFGTLLASNPLKNGLAGPSQSNGNSSGVDSSARSTASKSSAGRGSQTDSGNVTSPTTTPNSGSHDPQFFPSQAQPTPVEYKDNSNRRRAILLEMLSSEESYNKGLNELIDIYTRPAALPLESGDSKPAVPASEHRAVFSNVEGLQRFHQDAFLPSLRKAVQPLIQRQQEQIGGESSPEEDAAFTAEVAEEVAKVFTRHAAFFRMYSNYVNNCDSAQTRIQAWLLPSVSAAASAFKTNASSASSSSSDTIGGLTTSQRKRIKLFMKKARANPRHSQLNVESYLLLPVQRLPRYRLLLEDLVKSTPPFRLRDPEVTSTALDHIAKICSSVNESKRQSEQDRRLLYWQSRIRGRWPSPLVQPHRRLVKDGTLTLKRVVKRVPAFLAEQSASADDEDEDDIQDTSSSSLQATRKVPVDCLQQQSLDLNLILILCNDLTVTVQDSSNGRDQNAPVDLYAVLRVQASKPVQVLGGTSLRVCDARSILYFSAQSPAEAQTWAAAINSQNQD